MDEGRKITLLTLVIMTIIFALLGSTFAYVNWQTADSQKTNVVFTFEQDFWCAADGGGDITQDDVDIAPTSCTNSQHAIKREIKVTPTILRNGLTINMDLWLNINSMGRGLSMSDNFRYALTTNSNSCTEGVISSGNFKAMSAGNKIVLLDEMPYSSSTLQTYYLYIWLDAVETSDTTMLQSFNMSLGGNCIDSDKGDMYYAVYSETDDSFRFYNDEEEIKEGTTYNNLVATKVYTTYQNVGYSYDSSTTDTTTPWDEIRDNVKKIVIEDVIAPISTAYWFVNFVETTSIDVTKLDTSNVIDMSRMFDRTGYSSSVTLYELIGLNNWDTSNVTSMFGMFQAAGANATTWSIGDLSSWDTSNVVNMNMMFSLAGRNASTFNIGDLSGWNVSNVVSMEQMFSDIGRFNAKSVYIGDLSSWNVSKVQNMRSMFQNAVKDSAIAFNIGDLSNWDVSNLKNMEKMFFYAGYESPTFYIGDLSGWDVSNVTSMEYLFAAAGNNATTFDIGDLSNWDVSNVTNMYGMFAYSGTEATTFNIGDLSSWDTSNVVNMNMMFYKTGYTATNWSLNLSNWNVNNVTSYTDFKSYVENKVIAPIWVN